MRRMVNLMALLGILLIPPLIGTSPISGSDEPVNSVSMTTVSTTTTTDPDAGAFAAGVPLTTMIIYSVGDNSPDARPAHLGHTQHLLALKDALDVGVPLGRQANGLGDNPYNPRFYDDLATTTAGSVGAYSGIGYATSGVEPTCTVNLIMRC